MFAGVVHAPKDIRYEEINTPKLSPGEVLVRVKYTGICGSDIPRVNADAAHYYPIVLGHEFSGVIEEIAPDVKDRTVGDRVAGIPLVPCMKCDDCKNGNYALCKHYDFIGSRRFGSFAQYVAVPAENTFLIGDKTTFLQGAFFEPSTVAYHGLLCLPYEADKTVIILGSGTIGLLTLQWAKIKGAAKVVVVNRSPGKLEIADDLGADYTISTLEPNWKDKVIEQTDGKGFDYVYETAGSTEMIKEALALVGNKGGVCMIGTPKEPFTFSVREWEQINRKECIVTGSWMSYSAPFPGKEWEDTREHFESGKLQIPKEMIDRILKLEDIDEGFELFDDHNVKGKIIIDCD